MIEMGNEGEGQEGVATLKGIIPFLGTVALATKIISVLICGTSCQAGNAVISAGFNWLDGGRKWLQAIIQIGQGLSLFWSILARGSVSHFHRRCCFLRVRFNPFSSAKLILQRYLWMPLPQPHPIQQTCCHHQMIKSLIISFNSQFFLSSAHRMLCDQKYFLLGCLCLLIESDA